MRCPAAGRALCPSGARGLPNELHQAAHGQRDRLRGRHHEVIEHPDIHQAQRLPQAVVRARSAGDGSGFPLGWL